MALSPRPLEYAPHQSCRSQSSLVHSETRSEPSEAETKERLESSIQPSEKVTISCSEKNSLGLTPKDRSASHSLEMSDSVLGPLPPAPNKPIRVRLKPAAESIIRRGHPWVFAESIREQSRAGESGDLAVIYDRRDKFLAAGLYDAESPLRIRVAHVGKPTRIDDAFWSERIAAACGRRHGLFGPETTGYRLVNGESDGLPGMVLDRYEDTLVLKLYTAAWLPHLDTLLAAAEREHPGATILLRLARNLQATARQRADLTDGQRLAGADDSDTIVFHENGIRFHADVRHGQKTGFFLDQRDNRARVEKLAAGRDVLNCFSFSGGFSLYAARGGAPSVTDVDISEHALRSAKENFALNRDDSRIAQARHRTLQANVFDWLNESQQDRFDLVIIDPPSLAKKAADHDAALKAYRQLFTTGIRRLRTDGILVAASCSAHVRTDEFFRLVESVAANSRRPFHELERATHAPDHPATFAEAEYLKAAFLQFGR